MKLVQLPTISGASPLDNLSKPQVIELQNALAALGYTAGAADGVLGPSTRSAWAEFKADMSLGEPDSIGPGSVKALQQQLDAAEQGGVVPPAAVKIVKNYEGLRLQAYDDGVGVWTIGYGTTRYPNGERVKAGDSCTAQQAESYLQNDIAGYAKQLVASVPHWNQMNDNQRSALISFAYNLGPGFYGSSDFNTISRVLREKQWSGVPAALELYSMPGTNVHAGLLARRKAEGQLWLGKGPYAG